MDLDKFDKRSESMAYRSVNYDDPQWASQWYLVSNLFLALLHDKTSSLSPTSIDDKILAIARNAFYKYEDKDILIVALNLDEFALS